MSTPQPPQTSPPGPLSLVRSAARSGLLPRMPDQGEGEKRCKASGSAPPSPCHGTPRHALWELMGRGRERGVGGVRSAARARLALGVLVFLPACAVLPPIDFQRMIDQDRFQVWQHCAFFADGRAMRTPPEGTVPRDAPLGDPAVVDGAYAAEIPLTMTRPLLEAGKARFEAFCAPCHGLRGDGESVVAHTMDLRRPPAIAGSASRALPPGRIYQVIDQGYGLMRSYAEDLTTPEERWAVVAYLRALQVSHGVPLDTLPPDLRREAERQLR